MRVELTTHPIDIAAALAGAGGPAAGAVVLFGGVVRDHARGHRVVRLEYSAYEEMARRELAALVEEAVHRFELVDAILIHRLGVMTIGECTVLIITAAAHRAEAYAASRFLIDGLKARVPIWKQEVYEDGSAWIEGDRAVPGGGPDRQ